MIERANREPTWVVAFALTAVLVALGGRYGYHRDELYFVEAGKHLALAYPDQGLLTPLIAGAMEALAPASLTLLRLPAALAIGAVVVLSGLLARELGGGRGAELIAALSTASGVVFLQTGHTLGTTTFDLLVWTAVTWLAVRAIRTGEERLWLLSGVVLGIGLLNKPLPAFLAAGLLAGVFIAGPKELLRNRRVWAGATAAVLLWLPWLAWQASNGWPSLRSPDASPRAALRALGRAGPSCPSSLLLVGPLLATA